MVGTLDGFISYAESIANGPYYYNQGPRRCDPIHSGYADCSGLVVAALRSQGVDMYCTGSFDLARQCHRARTGISYEKAKNTRGALFFIGINEGQGGIPGVDPGHVAMCRGNGYTVEARNTRAGIGFWPTGQRNWDYCAMPPWLPIGPNPPTPPPKPPVGIDPEEELMIVLPQTGNPRGRVPTARIIKAYNCVLLEDGGRVDGDKQVKDDPTTHTWIPGSLPAGSLIVGVDKIEGQRTLVVRYNYPNGDSGTYQGHLP